MEVPADAINGSVDLGFHTMMSLLGRALRVEK
jgi:hypothetical protein